MCSGANGRWCSNLCSAPPAPVPADDERFRRFCNGRVHVSGVHPAVGGCADLADPDPVGKIGNYSYFFHPTTRVVVSVVGLP